jgi:hypothetical protein
MPGIPAVVSLLRQEFFLVLLFASRRRLAWDAHGYRSSVEHHAAGNSFAWRTAVSGKRHAKSVVSVLVSTSFIRVSIDPAPRFLIGAERPDFDRHDPKLAIALNDGWGGH